MIDIFTADKGGESRPVLIYVHGGAYVGGDKTRDGKGQAWPFYDSAMVWAVNNGMVVVNINYRLAPGAPYPAADGRG